MPRRARRAAVLHRQRQGRRRRSELADRYRGRRGGQRRQQDHLLAGLAVREQRDRADLGRGNNPSQTVATVVITNHGPRGVKDSTGYDHYSLLASLEGAFGLGCLQNACMATPMTPLFQITGSTTVPTLPAPFTPPPNGNNSISPMGNQVKGTKTTMNCAGGWQQVPSPSIGSLDNNLAALSPPSASNASASRDYSTPTNP